MNKKYFDRLVNILQQEKIDAMLIAPSEEMEFIINHNTHICERFQALFIKSDGTYFYICNLLTADEIQAALGPDIKVYGWFDGEIFTDIVKKAFEENQLLGKTIAVNSTERAFLILQIMEAVDVKFVNGKPLLEEMRMIKDEEEIENLRIAARITDESYEELLKFIKPGIKEADIANKMNEIFKAKGADEGFTMVAERNIKEISIWRELLIYAMLFGIADQVAEQMKELYPLFSTELNNYSLSLSTAYSYYYLLYSNMKKAEELHQQETRSSGMGGIASIGGGGGSIGGGSGGGTR